LISGRYQISIRRARRQSDWRRSQEQAGKLSIDALVMALQRYHPLRDLVHHSDRGVQYASEP
jgi:putative transposase